MPSAAADEFIKDFMAHFYDPTEYDPVQAHLDYLRRRQLKGRAPAAVKLPPKGRHPAKVIPLHPKGKGKVQAAAHHKSPAEVHKEIAARVATLNRRLAALKHVLEELVKKAKARSGVVTPTKPTPAKAAAPATPTSASKLTATQKAEKAKANKAYYEKHKNDATEANAQAIELQIQEVTAKITKMRADLGIAKQQVQNHKPVPVGAGSKQH